jgi:acetyl-CoA carboxylase carboxyl transferase subunit alpha
MLKELSGKDGKTLVADRRRKYLDIGGKGLAA